MKTSDLIKKPNTIETSISKHIWQSMLPMLQQHCKTVSISNTIAYKYRFDMYGLLQHLGVTTEYIYPNIIVNGYSSSTDFEGNIEQIKIVDAQYLHRIYSKINN